MLTNGAFGAAAPALTNVENLKGIVIVRMSVLEFLNAVQIIAMLTLFLVQLLLLLIVALILTQVRN